MMCTQSDPVACPAAAGSAAARHLRSLFHPEDYIALTLIHLGRGEVAQRVALAGRILADNWQAWLRFMNTTGFEIYGTANTLRRGTRRRTKADIDQVRHLYLDFDQDGDRARDRLLSRTDLPRPHIIVNTSSHKYQVLWRVSGFTVERAECLLRALARNTGSDIAATDAARVLRLPGFYNHKYDPPHFVTAQYSPGRILSPADFPALPELVSSPAPIPIGHYDRLSVAADATRSGRDWRYTLSQLRRGVNPQLLIAELAAERRDKSNPGYYAHRTVTRALAVIQNTCAPAHPEVNYRYGR